MPKVVREGWEVSQRCRKNGPLWENIGVYLSKGWGFCECRPGEKWLCHDHDRFTECEVYGALFRIAAGSEGEWKRGQVVGPPRRLEMKKAKLYAWLLNAEEEGFEPFFHDCSKTPSYVQFKPLYDIGLKILTSFDHF